MMKGEAGVRVSMWRAALLQSKADAAARAKGTADAHIEALQREVAAARQAAFDKTCARAGKELRLMFKRMTQGELGLRISIWQEHVREAMAAEAAYIQRQLDVDATLRKAKQTTQEMLQRVTIAPVACVTR